MEGAATTTNLGRVNEARILEVAANNGIQELTGVMRELLDAQRETNRLLRKELEPKSKWVDGDEAARIIGKRVVPSKEHLKTLKWARDKGHLLTFASRSPYRYLRAEVEQLQRDVAAGKIWLP